MTSEPELEHKFTPQGLPFALEQLSEYTDQGDVAIRRLDVERAIATADPELRKHLEARQYKQQR